MIPALRKALSLFLIATPALSWSGDPITIQSFSGTVQYRTGQKTGWQKAEKGLQVPDGGSVRTSDGSRAVLRFPNKSVVWMKPNTNLGIRHTARKLARIFLRQGDIKVRVPHLKRKEKFEIRTPVAVAAVRGTVFNTSFDMSPLAKEGKLSPELDGFIKDGLERSGEPAAGNSEDMDFDQQFDAIGKFIAKAGGYDSDVDLTRLSTLFGNVAVTDTTTGSDSKNKRMMYIPQGTTYDGENVRLITGEEETIGLEDWNPDLEDSNRQEGLRKNEESRNEIETWAKANVEEVKSNVSELTGQIKEADIAAGRTLTDVHGNLVRVDQLLERPDGNAIQVTNVVKRTSYASGGLRKYAYNGANSSRFDALIAKAEFNKKLPEQLNELPGFFSKNKDTLKVDRASVIAANIDETGVFAMGFFGNRDASSGTDEIDADLYVGTLGSRSQLFNLSLGSDKEVAGLTRFVQDKRVKEIQVDGAGGELYRNSATRWHRHGDANNVLWVATENYVINNAGKVRHVNDFTSGNADFADLISNTAGEAVLFAKEQDSAFAVSDTSSRPSNIDATNFSGGNSAKKNIDLVIIPDLPYSAIKNIATGGDSLKNAY